MRFIKVWAYSCAKYLANQLNQNHERRSVHYFSFQVIFGGIIKTVVLFSIALLVGTIIPSLIILLMFGTLRVLAGGFHMDTYGKCIATSTILFIGASMFSQYTYKYWSKEQIIILISLLIITGIFIIIKWAPKDTPNKPITNKEHMQKLKNQSLIYIICFGALSLGLLYFGAINDLLYINLIIISACLGAFLELFTVTPIGYGFFEKISGQK